MEQNLIRLLYISEATETVTPETVRPILVTSREKNPEAGVCGLLCYSDQYFFQFLEGDELEVMKLYLKITKDKRHKNCRIVHITTAQERLFQDWSMGALEEKHCQPIDFSDLERMRKTFSSEVNPALVIRDLLTILQNSETAA